MIASSDAEHADYLGRRRARMLPVLLVIYLSQQVTYFSSAGQNDRSVDHAKVFAWVVLSLGLLAGLATKGFWFRKRQVRDLIDDEITRANRLDALRWGYLMTVGTAVALFFIEQFEPMSVREAIHAIVSLGLGTALLRFAILERRAHRG